MTALGNVSEALKTVHKLPKREAEDRAMAQLRKVGLEKPRRALSVQLSGGQQQRVAIAAHWRCSRRSCCSTSRPRRWTRN